jgi:hypothetical protein
VRVDSVGIGYGFAQHLQDCFAVEFVNVGMACESKPHGGANDPARRFGTRKGYYYQELADAFEKGQVEGLTDERTIGQLAGILYEIDSQGRLRIESKEQARARGLLSPDRAEALMLALCKPPQKYEYTPVRNLYRSGSAPNRWLCDPESPDDEGDDDYDISGFRRNRLEGFAPGSLARFLRKRGALLTDAYSSSSCVARPRCRS